MLQSELSIVNPKDLSDVYQPGAELRVAEKLILVFFALTLMAGVWCSISLEERLKLWGLNLVVGGIVLLLCHHGKAKRSGPLGVVRDWFPCIIIPLAYRESGIFFIPDPTHHLDYLFIRGDNLLLQSYWVAHGLSFVSGWLVPYLELSYFLCYPLVPLGLLSLIWARQSGALKPGECSGGKLAIDRFWTAVLLAVFTCYVAYPFFPLTPPRILFPNLGDPTAHSALRQINLWLLRRNGDQASLFPSGHVASVTATALAVRAALPRVGWIFLVAAASVAAATVVGRYHYAADAAAGALVGSLAFAVANRIHQP